LQIHGGKNERKRSCHPAKVSYLYNCFKLCNNKFRNQFALMQQRTHFGLHHTSKGCKRVEVVAGKEQLRICEEGKNQIQAT